MLREPVIMICLIIFVQRHVIMICLKESSCDGLVYRKRVAFSKSLSLRDFYPMLRERFYAERLYLIYYLFHGFLCYALIYYSFDYSKVETFFNLNSKKVLAALNRSNEGIDFRLKQFVEYAFDSCA